MKKTQKPEVKASTATKAEVLNPEVAQAINEENAAASVNELKAISKKEKKAAKKAKLQAKAAKAETAPTIEVISAETHDIQVTPTADGGAKVSIKEKKNKKAKKASKEEAATIKEVAKQQKASLIEKVVANREVKYIYPEDVKDTLSRKTWRQKTRNKLHQLELAVSRIKDQNSKEYKAALKEYNDFKKEVLKPEQVA